MSVRAASRSVTGRTRGRGRGLSGSVACPAANQSPQTPASLLTSGVALVRDVAGLTLLPHRETCPSVPARCTNDVNRRRSRCRNEAARAGRSENGIHYHRVTQHVERFDVYTRRVALSTWRHDHVRGVSATGHRVANLLLEHSIRRANPARIFEGTRVHMTHHGGPTTATGAMTDPFERSRACAGRKRLTPFRGLRMAGTGGRDRDEKNGASHVETLDMLSDGNGAMATPTSDGRDRNGTVGADPASLHRRGR